MAKRIALFLLGACLLFTCTSCGDTAQSSSPTQQSQAASAPPQTTEFKYSDNLPDLNYEGKQFVVASFENLNFHYTTAMEEETGDVINDSIYKRTLSVEERLNIDIVQQLYKDGDGSVKKSVLAGDDAYDVAVIRCPEALSFWQEGLLHTMDEVPNIDLSQPYWDQGINESLSINNKHYVALGAFDLCTYDLTFALLFNKDMVKNYGLESPYELVKNGKWTMDKMNEMMTSVVKDINGDGVMDEKDQYGYLSHPKMVMPGFWIGAGEMSVVKDENDMPVLNMGSEGFVSVFQKIFEITWDNKAWYQKDGVEDVPVHCIEMFSAGQSLFMDVSFFYIESLRGAETDFGIIPYPKYNEEQEDYACRVCYYMPTVVPITNTDLDMTGAVLEALNCESANTVIPAYYDIALKTKYSRDDESSEMLDLIFASRVIDIGDSTLCDKIRDTIVYSMFKNNNRDIVSKISGAENIIKNFIKKMPV